jgi:hypothetical protein
LIGNDESNKALSSMIDDIEDNFMLFTKNYLAIEDFVRIIPTITEKRYIERKEEMYCKINLLAL